MAGRVIQGFFIGGAMRPQPAHRAESRPRHPTGAPSPAFAGRAAPLQARMAPGRPPPAHRGAGHVAQPHGGNGRFEIDPVQLGLARGGGKPLPKAVLAKMEAAFGADFSAVRVHVGPQAARIGAVAFTTGNDLYFAPGQFQPDSVKGQQLLGHELAHVIQQRQGRVRAPGGGVAVVQDRALEAEADRLGERAAAFPPIQRRSPALPGPRPPGSAPIQRSQEARNYRHGFDFLELGDAEFLETFRYIAKTGGGSGDVNLTEYDSYKLLERMQRIKAAGGPATAGVNFHKLEADFRDMKELPDRTDLIGRIRGEIFHLPKKAKKPGDHKTLLLGTYLDSKGQPHVAGTLGAFVEDADPTKKVSRGQKWLRVGNEEWTSEVNAKWLAAGIEDKRPFKIVSPLAPEALKALLLLIITNKTGLAFLKALRLKYFDRSGYGSSRHATANPLWDDRMSDPGSHRPSFLSYEIAELIDAGYKVDWQYVKRKGMIKMVAG